MNKNWIQTKRGLHIEKQREQIMERKKRISGFLKNMANQKDNTKMVCRAHPCFPWVEGKLKTPIQGKPAAAVTNWQNYLWDNDYTTHKYST
jgi:hypothetical protein